MFITVIHVCAYVHILIRCEAWIIAKYIYMQITNWMHFELSPDIMHNFLSYCFKMYTNVTFTQDLRFQKIFLQSSNTWSKKVF